MLEFLEDYYLGQRMLEVADDEMLTAAEARVAYQALAARGIAEAG